MAAAIQFRKDFGHFFVSFDDDRLYVVPVQVRQPVFEPLGVIGLVGFGSLENTVVLSSVVLQQPLHASQNVHDVRIGEADSEKEEGFLRQIAFERDREQLALLVVGVVILFGDNGLRRIC